jgi:hypothetical protein
VAVRKDWIISRGRSWGNRDDLHDPGEWLHQRVIIGTLKHEETNRTVNRGEQQNRIHHRNMVRDQQRTALGRNMVTACQMDAIQGMGRDPQQEPQQGIGQQVEHIDCGQDGEQGNRKEDLRGAEVVIVLEDVIEAGRAPDADKREQIGGGDDPAFILFIGAVLNERVHRYGKETGGESEGREQPQNSGEGKVWSGEQDPEHGHADRAQGN